MKTIDKQIKVNRLAEKINDLLTDKTPHSVWKRNIYAEGVKKIALGDKYSFLVLLSNGETSPTVEFFSDEEKVIGYIEEQIDNLIDNPKEIVYTFCNIYFECQGKKVAITV